MIGGWEGSVENWLQINCQWKLKYHIVLGGNHIKFTETQPKSSAATTHAQALNNDQFLVILLVCILLL